MAEKRRRIGTPEPSNEPASNKETPIDLISSFIDTSQDSLDIANFIKSLINSIDKRDLYSYLEQNIQLVCDFINELSHNNPKAYLRIDSYAVGHGEGMTLCPVENESYPTSIFISPPKGYTFTQVVPESARLYQAFSECKNVSSNSICVREKNRKSSESYYEKYEKQLVLLKDLLRSIKTVKKKKDTELLIENIKRFNNNITEYGNIPIENRDIDSIILYISAIINKVEKIIETSTTSIIHSADSVKSCGTCENESGVLCSPSITLSGSPNLNAYDRPRFMVALTPKSDNLLHTLKIEAMLYFLLQTYLINNNIILHEKYNTYNDIKKHFFETIEVLSTNPIVMNLKIIFDVLIENSVIRKLVTILFNIDLPSIPIISDNKTVSVNLGNMVPNSDSVIWHCCLSHVDTTMFDKNMSDPSTPRGKGGSKKRSICPYCTNHLRIIQWDLTTPDKIMARNISWSQFFGKLRPDKSIKKKHYKSARKSKRRSA